MCPRSRLPAVIGGLMVAVGLLTACNGGVRPTLVEDQPATPQPRLELALPPAPPSVGPLPPAGESVPVEVSVDDALLAWALDRNIAYADACERVTPEPGELCDVATERDTVRLLGPSADEIWYVVTVLETDSLDFGTGYRVSDVQIAGR